MIKKLFAFAIVVSISFWALAPGVSAITAEELQAQIDTLLAQLATLQTQLSELTGEPTTTIVGCTITSFDRNLSQGMTGDDVKCLQIVLNTDTVTKLADSGAGSPGNETTYFGPITKAGAIKFQEKYADEVLASWGLTSGTGYIGSTSRAKLNTLLAAGGPTVECTTDADCATGYECVSEVCTLESVTPVEGSALQIDLAADTPESATIADNANAYFTKFTLTAGDDDVSITKIYVTRSGLTANSDLENVKIYDIDGVYHGSVGSFNVASQARLYFTPKLVIEAGESESYYIRAGFIDGATAGKTATLGIASADDIICDAEEVTGDFPVNGNPMSVVTLTIGSAVFAESPTTIDSKPDVGDTDVIVNNFTLTAGATEGVTLESLTVLETGTAGLSDIENIELYSVTDSKSLGTVESWSSEGKASWSDLNISIAKGEKHRFKIMVDIVDGAGLTVNADGEDGTDVLASVKGNTYGFYVTPTWTGDGDGSNDQTINAGTLNVSKSASTPATGNIAAGDDQALVIFDFTATGEEIRITALTLDFDLSGITYDEITLVKIVDEDGDIVCGPNDVATSSTADPDAHINYTDTFIVPVGTHQYTVKAKIADAAGTGDYVECGIDAVATDITAKGMTSNEAPTITPTGAVEGNRQTVAARNLVATTLTYPPARTIARGITDYIWMTASLDAGASGEDVIVTAIVLEDATSSNSTSHKAKIDNAEIWADLTSANSDRGDAYETKVTNTEQPDESDTHSFTLTDPITVPKATFVRIALLADLATDENASSSHTWFLDTDAADVTAYGADTGETVSVTPGGSGQTMTVTDKGDADVLVDASSPSSALLLDAELATVAIFKIQATTTHAIEDLDLDSILITDDGTGDIVDTYYFYHGDTLLGTAPGAATASIQVTDGTVTIPADGYELITVKALFDNIDNTDVKNKDTIRVSIAASGDVDLTGLASGQAVDPDNASVDAASSTLYESYPIFSVNANSPTGDLIPQSSMLLAILDVTAAGNKDITWDGAADPSGGTEDDVLYVQISSLDGASTTAALANITVKDQDGELLDSTSTAYLAGQTNISIDFSEKDFVVPAGATRQLYFYVDTPGFITTGDYIHLWLDADGSDIIWSINYNDADYVETAQVFKNDIHAGTLVK